MTIAQAARVLLWIFLLSIPTQLGKHFWPTWALVQGIRSDYLSPTVFASDLVLLVLAATVFIRPSQKIGRRPLRLGSFSGLTRTAVVAYLVGRSLAAVHPPLSFYWSLRYLEIPLVAWVVKRSLTNWGSEVSRQLQASLAIGALFSVSLGVIQMVLGRTTGWLWILGERSFTVATPGISTVAIWGRQVLRPYATFPHPNALAGWLLAVSFLLSGRGQRIFRYLSRAGVLLTASRSALLALAAALTITALSPTSLRSTGAGLVLAPNSETERVALATAARQIIREHPLFGVGPGQFLRALPNRLPPGTFLVQPVHNVPLLLTAELGLFGVSLVVLWMITEWRRAGTTSVSVFLPLGISLGVTGLLDHYWITAQQNRLLLGISIGMVLAGRSLFSSWEKRSTASPSPRLRSSW